MLESLFNKVVGLKACNFIKRRLQHKCFPVKFAKCLRVPFLQNLFSRVLFFLQNSKFFWQFVTLNGKGVSKILNLNGTNGEKFRKFLLSEKIVSRRSKITVTHI